MYGVTAAESRESEVLTGRSLRFPDALSAWPVRGGPGLGTAWDTKTSKHHHQGRKYGKGGGGQGRGATWGGDQVKRSVF